MYTGQSFGGKKRFYYSALAESTFNTAKSRDRVLNPLDGSELVGPPNIPHFANANSAQGQGEWATRLYKGAEDHQGSPTFALTPEAFGKFMASALGSDSKSTVDTDAIQHDFTLSAAERPAAFTIEEHIDGAADTTNSWYMSGAYANAVTINVNRGNQYATISPHIVASKYGGAGSDESSGIDADTTNWPDVPGIAPTKCFLFMYATENNQHDSVFDGAFAPFTTPGVCADDLSTHWDIGVLASSWTLTFATGVDLNESYRAGTSAGAGFVRGQPYSLARACSLTVNFDLTSATDGFLTYFKDFTDAAPISYTMQFSFASDDKPGTGTYYSGGSFVCNAMRITGKPNLDGTIGPATGSVTFEGIEPGDGGETAYVEAISWDDIDVDYGNA